jgi:cyclophilin family peptidyl-prolyl cis-trans isomerase/HEAT repeat protein
VSARALRLAAAAVLACWAAGAAAETRLHKLARVLALEDRRSTGDGELVRLLQDPDKGVRRRAALAAGRIGDALAVLPLVELMNDADAELRQMAAFALGLIGDRAAGERLAAALQDPDAAVRGRAAEALGRIGDAARAPAIATMLQAALPKGAQLVTVRGDDAGNANDPWLELRLGLFALARLKDTAAAEQVLAPGGRSRFDWWAATWTAMRIAAPSLRPVLLQAAASNDAASRALAARGLGALKDQGSLELLAKLAQDREEDVAVQALRALGALGDARGTSAVASALNSPNLVLKWEALKALALLPPDPGLRARLLPFLGHEQAWIRAAAFPALARADRNDFALVLSGLDPDPEWSVRGGLARALGDVADETSVALLHAMLKDEDVRVLPAVLEALRKARGNDALPTLRQHLQHRDFAVRAAAADGLAELKATGLSEPLLAAYRLSLPDVDVDARLSIVSALLLQKDEPAKRALLEVAQQDPVRAVRARATEALRTLGEKPPAIGPETAARAGLDDRAALLPFEPQPDRPLYTPRAILYTRKGRIEIHLNIVDTPLTSESFLSLARRGYYDGLTFHRVVPGFVAQAGCPRGDGSGGPGYTLRCELGPQPYGRGIVGMALSGRDTGGSQFFIAHQPAPHLDGAYTAFGRVVSGMEVVDQLRPGDVIERVEIWDGR